MKNFYFNDSFSIQKTYNRIRPQKKQDRITSKVVFIIVSVLLLFEVFSGALRYYFAQFGFSFVIYLPKIACLIAVLFKIGSFKIKSFWPIFILIFSILVSLFNSASFSNIMFSLFVYSPLLFGILFGKYIEIKQKGIFFVICICLISSIVGIYLDFIVELPWKGFVYSIGDVEVQANRQWSTLGQDRIAGFSRSSAPLAVMIVVFSMYINAYLRSNFIRLLLFFITFYSIFLTTNKSALISYLLGFLIYFLYKQQNFSRVLFYTITIIGIVLPIIGIFLDYSINTRGLDTLTKSLLFSFDDRLTNTWPYFYQNIIRNNGFIWGTGIGTVGSPITTFPIQEISVIKGYGLGVADNTSLYLWGTFGLLGVWIYTRFYWLMKKLMLVKNNFSVALSGIVVCICVISWTTDILEAVVSSLFIGIAISIALRKNKTVNLQ